MKFEGKQLFLLKKKRKLLLIKIESKKTKNKYFNLNYF